MSERHEPCQRRKTSQNEGRRRGRTSSQAARAPTDATEASTNASPTAWLGGLVWRFGHQAVNTSRKFQRLGRCTQWGPHMLSSHPPACEEHLLRDQNFRLLCTVWLSGSTQKREDEESGEWGWYTGTKVVGRGRVSHECAHRHTAEQNVTLNPHRRHALDSNLCSPKACNTNDKKTQPDITQTRECKHLSTPSIIEQ